MLIFSRPMTCALLMASTHLLARDGQVLLGVELESDREKMDAALKAAAIEWEDAKNKAALMWDSDWLPPENSPWLPDWQSLNELRHPVFLPVSMDTKHTLAPAIRRFLLYGSMATRGTAAYRVKT